MATSLDDPREPGSITRMIEDLEGDDPSRRERAAEVVWQRYVERLLGLARRHLSGQVRRRVDEYDVLQSVFRTVYQRQRDGAFVLQSRDDLWNLLAAITVRKARGVAARHTRDKRDVRRESIANGCSGADASTLDPLERLAEDEPTPEQAQILTEALQRRLDALDDPLLQQIALRKLEGYTNHEIAAQIERTDRTVERKLDLIRQRWIELDAEPDDEACSPPA